MRIYTNAYLSLGFPGGFPGGSDSGLYPWVRKIPLEKGMATHSSILVWRIPWTEEPGGLQSVGLQRVGHNWVTNAFTFFTFFTFNHHEPPCSVMEHTYTGLMKYKPYKLNKNGSPILQEVEEREKCVGVISVCFIIVIQLMMSQDRIDIWGLFPGSSAGKESACNKEDLGSIPGLGGSPGEGKSYPLQYSGLENSMNCIVHGVTKSWTQLSDFRFHFHF